MSNFEDNFCTKYNFQYLRCPRAFWLCRSRHLEGSSSILRDLFSDVKTRMNSWIYCRSFLRSDCPFWIRCSIISHCTIGSIGNFPGTIWGFRHSLSAVCTNRLCKIVNAIHISIWYTYRWNFATIDRSMIGDNDQQKPSACRIHFVRLSNKVFHFPFIYVWKNGLSFCTIDVYLKIWWILTFEKR